MFLLAVTVAGGIAGGRLGAASDATNPGFKEYSDILATARAWYADDVPANKLVYASIHGMLGTLDPHTNFLEPEEYSSMVEKQRGSFYGLGIIISKRNGKVTVITPVEGSPAARLGIRAGDIIDRVEGQSIDDLPVDAVVKKLKGPKGTKVNITILRPGLDEPLQMTVTRAEIPTNSVSYAYMLEPGVGYIRLKDFTHTSAPELQENWEKLEKLGMKKLVFDLRGNPGGLLDQAIAVSDFFLGQEREGRRDARPQRRPGAELRVARQEQPRAHPRRRPREQGLRVGVRDRRGRAAGPRPRRHRRPDHVGQGPRAVRLQPLRRRRPRAHVGEVLHALGPLHPAGLQGRARVPLARGRGGRRQRGNRARARRGLLAEEGSPSERTPAARSSAAAASRPTSS